MANNSSGLIFQENPDGTAAIGIEIYNSELLGGDCETMYYLDAQNYEKLVQALDPQEKSVRARLVEEFTEEFYSLDFEKYCKKHKIEFQKEFWIH